jgi:predicted HAD superfamily Cof-like phosphohydrolase
LHPDLNGDVVAFHEKFQAQNPTRLPNHELEPKMQEFAIKHLQEELDEYKAAVARRDSVDVLDSLVDLIYVALGAVHKHGMSPSFDEAWRRVHSANMAKVRAEKATDSKRGAAFDIVKPVGWIPPDLSDLV